MNTERTEKFVNAIACDLEEGGFRQVSGTMLRRTLATAVSAALPLLQSQAGTTSALPSTPQWRREMSDTKISEAAVPLAWISRVRCVGPEFGKEIYGKLPVQSLQPGYYEHIPLYGRPVEAGVPMHVLEQILRDPNNQPSQFGTVPVEMLERCERLLDEAQSQQPAASSPPHLHPQPAELSFDVEAMLAACVPGGSIVDPQVVADNIRAWAAERKPAELAEPSGNSGEMPPPDEKLLRFYDVSTYPQLVAALEEHVMKLLDLRKRNVKPWEDTFPPTLLPKYERDQHPVFAKDLLALADRWQDAAAETWGEGPVNSTKQDCCDELRDVVSASIYARAALAATGKQQVGEVSEGEFRASASRQTATAESNVTAEAMIAHARAQVGEVQGDARAQFEAWAKTVGFGIQRDENGDYLEEASHGGWCAWQAALAARRPGDK